MADQDGNTVAGPGRRRGPGIAIACAALLIIACGGCGALIWWHHPVALPPIVIIPSATEAELRAEIPQTLTMRRFAPNPAIIVLDFPTVAEQGRMLNRLAAWAEKIGVPHDRLLDDLQLAAAIRASGSTPETYYLGHDYRGDDIDRFFALADRDHIQLNRDEAALRALVAQARREPFGLRALITLPRADPANQVDPVVRAVILHHELSHGEYFTNALYAAFVATIWQSILTVSERVAFRSYLAEEDYDPGLEDLMMNEMQAYLMHTPDRRFFDPEKLGILPARLAAIRRSFAEGMPSCWLRDETTVPPSLPNLPAPPARMPAIARRQRTARVSRIRAVAATLPLCRRRLSTAF